jgi:hypothetical protein
MRRRNFTLRSAHAASIRAAFPPQSGRSQTLSPIIPAVRGDLLPGNSYFFFDALPNRHRFQVKSRTTSRERLQVNASRRLPMQDTSSLRARVFERFMDESQARGVLPSLLRRHPRERQTGRKAGAQS